MTQMDLSGPHMIAASQAGSGVSYDVDAALRLSDETHGRSSLLAWTHNVCAKEQCDILDASESMFDGIPLEGILFERRVSHGQTARGTERLPPRFQDEMNTDKYRTRIHARLRIPVEVGHGAIRRAYEGYRSKAAGLNNA